MAEVTWNPIKCTLCGCAELQPGYVSDRGEGAQGYGKWVAGPLETGILGGAKSFSRPKLAISAWRCPCCSHLELFAFLD